MIKTQYVSVFLKQQTSWACLSSDVLFQRREKDFLFPPKMRPHGLLEKLKDVEDLLEASVSDLRLWTARAHLEAETGTLQYADDFKNTLVITGESAEGRVVPGQVFFQPGSEPFEDLGADTLLGVGAPVDA